MLKCAYRVVINKKDNEQLTALHWATMCDHYKHAAALLKFQVGCLACRVLDHATERDKAKAFACEIRRWGG